jgi:hypothetical protein
LERTATGNAQDIGNTLSAQSATLRRIGQQISDLNDVVAAVQAQNTTILTQQGQINAAIADLGARISVTTTLTSFNTGSLPNDGTFHPYGGLMPITINVPTGKLLVTVGCGQATVNSGGPGGGVTADATFEIVGVVPMETYAGSAYTGGGEVVGASLCIQRAFSLVPGVYTIYGQMWAWASGTSSGSVQFQQPYLTVQVTG